LGSTDTQGKFKTLKRTFVFDNFQQDCVNIVNGNKARLGNSGSIAYDDGSLYGLYSDLNGLGSTSGDYLCSTIKPPRTLIG